MGWFNAFSIRLRAAIHRDRLDRDLEDELRFHLEMKTEENLEAGTHPSEARTQAVRQFGNRTTLKEISREMFGFGSLEILARDLRYGVRTLRNSLGFTATIIVTLALGIGANTAIFSLINAVMLRSLPVAAPAQLVSVGDPSRTGSLSNGSPAIDVFSYPLYKKVRERNEVFTDVLASGRTGRLDVSVDGFQKPETGADGETARGRLVSANYFDVLGVRPLLGRTFGPEEDRAPGASAVVVISYNYWQRRFAANAGILGTQIRINGTKFTILGVGPRDFFGDAVGISTDVWIPLMMQAQVNPGTFFLDKTGTSWLLLMGRLKPGASVGQARASLNILVQNLFKEAEGSKISEGRLREIREMNLQVEPGGRGFSALRKRFSQPLLILMGLVGLVLLIACTSVANLLLARASSRQKEIGMRLTLGASRVRLIRQLLTESILLAALGGAAGILFAWWSASILLRFASSDPTAPLPLDVRPDPSTLLFTAGVAIFTGFMFGLVPALRATHHALWPALKERNPSLARGGARWNLGKTLVIAQVALSLLLLVGAGLFARTLRSLETIDVGYRREGLVMLGVDPIGSGYMGPRAVQACRGLLATLQATPGVRAAAVSENGIFSGTESSTGGLMVEGYRLSDDRDRVDHYDRVGPHYFGTVGIPLLKGRDFDERDEDQGLKVAVINETMANFYFPRADPLGKHLTTGQVAYTIVGVSRDARDHELKEAPPRRFYTPYLEDPKNPIDGFNFEIRTTRDAASAIPGIRAAVREFDRNLKIESLATAASMIDKTVSDERLIARLSELMGALALLLAATGLYGVMSYATSRRSGEIGLRMALGANRGTVVWMVLSEALLLALVGVAVGIPAALGAARLVQRNIVGLSTGDPLVLCTAAAIMIATAVMAGLLPAARASRIDPMTALRQE
jgi:predicted permease